MQAYIASREAETGVMMRWAEAQLPGEVPRLLAAMQTRAAGAALSALTLACATTNSEREREGEGEATRSGPASSESCLSVHTDSVQRCKSCES